MNDMTDHIRQVALCSGADLVGFAPIGRFANAPDEFHPSTVYPQTRTVIAIALRQPRGALKAVEEGAYWQSYNCDSYQYLNEVLAPQVLRRIILALEAKGYTSVPVHNPFHPHSGRQLRHDQPAGPDGMISLRVIGVAAGLGELGVSKLLLTPQFGPRQRVFAVFTDAELEPTPLFEGSICDECGECVEECEACAIGTSRDVTIEIDGRVFAHASFDPQACTPVHNGADPRFSPFWTGHEPDGGEPTYHAFLKHRFRHLATCVGRGCIRSCLNHLEKIGRIEAQFKTPLIERERWKLGVAPEGTTP